MGAREKVLTSSAKLQRGGKGGYVGFSLIKREQRGSINYISSTMKGGGDGILQPTPLTNTLFTYYYLYIPYF